MYSRFGELVVIDITDKTSPSVINHLTYIDEFSPTFMENHYLLSVVVDGSYAYVASVRVAA